MIVCVCNRVSERDIEQAVRAGSHHFDALCDDTRVASCCGRCHDCAREVFDAACARHGVVPATVGAAGRVIALQSVRA